MLYSSGLVGGHPMGKIWMRGWEDILWAHGGKSSTDFMKFRREGRPKNPVIRNAAVVSVKRATQSAEYDDAMCNQLYQLGCLFFYKKDLLTSLQF